MAARRDNILVVGGGSRIATSLAPLLGERARFVSRRPSGLPREIAVENYDMLSQQMFDGIEYVVNCVGVSSGDAALMQRVNVDIPLALARTARAAGTRRIIHISSFSVYGGAGLIDERTPTRPTSDYGRSKLAADIRLLALADDRFAVTALRLPLIYAPESLGKLGRLLKLWTRMRVLPVPAADVSRAMISADLTASVVARLCEDFRPGVCFAADPMPFTYVQAAAARSETLFRLPLPAVATHAAERVAPAIAARLFADSHLSDADNLAIGYGLSSQLYRDIANAALH
ncbi:hypothetical protein SKP52_10500 [Sphingopyxis fribergensis]|uniref:NAD-dependent epimerase/dehydratase domain-containing protein n=2 Tax=Sphingopyxis fribergensis TaxID=1515612 RepID=A0A0A7PG68_9SPHN|nr:hypothetical protein SKP52_10500 [Sphingopyxis fribergensis]